MCHYMPKSMSKLAGFHRQTSDISENCSQMTPQTSWDRKQTKSTLGNSTATTRESVNLPSQCWYFLPETKSKIRRNARALKGAYI